MEACCPAAIVALNKVRRPAESQSATFVNRNVMAVAADVPASRPAIHVPVLGRFFKVGVSHMDVVFWRFV